MVADGFPVLNALKEAHLILSQGAHNQFGDLPSTARIEMLMQQWILARPEFREFIPTRIMVAYPEPWMDRVDAMKKLQGWTDTSVLHFRNLAIFGEQVLLGSAMATGPSIYEPVHAVNWARYWRPAGPGLPSRLSLGDRRRPLRRRHQCADRRDDAFGASGEAPGRTAPQRLMPGYRAMPDFTSALYLGFAPSERLSPALAGADPRPAGRPRGARQAAGCWRGSWRSS